MEVGNCCAYKNRTQNSILRKISTLNKRDATMRPDFMDDFIPFEHLDNNLKNTDHSKLIPWITYPFPPIVSRK